MRGSFNGEKRTKTGVRQVVKNKKKMRKNLAFACMIKL